MPYPGPKPKEAGRFGLGLLRLAGGAHRGVGTLTGTHPRRSRTGWRVRGEDSGRRGSVGTAVIWALLPAIVLAWVTGTRTQHRLLWWTYCCQHASNADFRQATVQLSWLGNERLRFKQDLVGAELIDWDSPTT
jgi:hypothetical protein